MKTAARYVAISVLFLIPFIPLYIANGLFFPFITGKAFAFRILVEIATGAYVVLALADARYRPRFSWTLVLYGAFILWMLIADLAGVNPHKALWSNFERMEGWITLIHVFLFFLVAGAVLSGDTLWRKWWLVFISGSALVSLACVAQLLCAGHACGANGLFAIHQGGVRIDGTFGNAAYLAAYFLFAIAVTVWQALTSRGWLSYALYALAVIEALLVFATATRGAILGLIAGIIVATVVWMIEAGGRARKIAGGLLIGIVLLSGLFYLVRNAPAIQSEPTLARIASIGPKDLSVRFTLWHMALEGVAERPVLGWGQEGFNYVFNSFYNPSLYAQEPWFDRAHNAFLDWLVAGGIPGFLLFLAAFAMAVYALYRGGAPREERVLLIAALVAYAVQGLVVFDNLFTYVPLAAILATAHAVSARPWKRVSALPTLTEGTLQIAAPAVLVATLIIVWVVNVPNIAAASELVRAISITSNDITPNVELFQKALAERTFAEQEVREQLVMFTSNVASQQSGPSPALSQLTSFALTEMKKEIDHEPKDARLRLEYALGFRAAGDSANALAQIQIAHDLSPKKQSILTEEGIDYWQTGQFDKSRDAFMQAYELDPSFTSIVPFVAAADIAGGDIAGGKALLAQKLGTTTVNNDLLVLSYYQAKDYPDLVLVLEQALRENPSAQNMYRLAAGYATAGRVADARREISAMVAQHPETAAQAAEFLKHVPAGQ